MKNHNSSRRMRALLTGCCLSLSLLGTLAVCAQPASAQEATQGKQGASGADAKTEAATTSATDTASAPAELPLLLLVVQRPAGTPARANDINASLSLMLRSTLRESRRYQVVLYSPDHPSIRRAILEHSIASSELVEPIKIEALQKLAHLLGARYILTVSSVLDKIALKTDVRLMQDMGIDQGQETWITPRAEPITVDAQLGKLRLKPEQLLALTVDNIDGFLGIPSHLADNIHLAHTKVIGTPIAANDKDAKNKKDKGAGKSNAESDQGEKVAANDGGGQNDKNDRNAKIASSQKAASGNASDSATNTGSEPKNGGKTKDGGKTARANTSGTKAAVKPKKEDAQNGDERAAHTAQAAEKTGEIKSPPKPETKTNRNTQIARNTDTPEKTAPSTTANTEGSTGEAPLTPRPRPQARGNAPSPTILATDAGALLLAEPRIIPPAVTLDTVNYEKTADNYKRTGDISNFIEALRQAINDNPRDIRLRKKLILAYQDRQLPDQAISETERAMRLDPADADLSRLYANSLTAKGDTTGAIKLLRGIVSADPKNTAAQVALGDALLADSQFADALSAFEAAAQNDPKSPLPHRRLARVLAARAGSDPTQYAACLQQVMQARSLTPATETQTYQGDYIEILFLIESRLKDMLDQVNETSIAIGKRPANEVTRTANDLKERAEAAADFLDKLPPAAGQDVTHAHYQQGAALLAQTVGYLRKYIQTGDAQIGESLRGTRIDALTELTNAHARLQAARAALDKGGAASGFATASN